MELLAGAGTVAIPPAVEAELTRLDLRWHRERPAWIAVRSLTANGRAEAAGWQTAGLLDAGEAEALVLAKEVKASWLLTDDAAARLIAQHEGLEVHGSLGVVLWAAGIGRLDRGAAEVALDRLAGSSLWLSARVLGEARAALRELTR